MREQGAVCTWCQGPCKADLALLAPVGAEPVTAKDFDPFTVGIEITLVPVKKES